jgi:hypothetical protein
VASTGSKIRAIAVRQSISSSTPRRGPSSPPNYDLNVSPDGLARHAALSHRGFRNVLELRNEFDGFETPQDIGFLASPKSGLFDLSFYRRALVGLRHHDDRDDHHEGSCAHRPD